MGKWANAGRRSAAPSVVGAQRRAPAGPVQHNGDKLFPNHFCSAKNIEKPSLGSCLTETVWGRVFPGRREQQHSLGLLGCSHGCLGWGTGGLWDHLLGGRGFPRASSSFVSHGPQSLAEPFIPSLLFSPFLVHLLAIPEMPSGLWKWSKYLRCVFVF